MCSNLTNRMLMTMTYSYNPHRHVKIWLSNDRDSFLNLKNQLHLVTLRATNPEDEINLVYDDLLLSTSALKELTESNSSNRIRN